MKKGDFKASLKNDYMSDKYVLITGATSGIGLEFTKIYHRKGYSLILVARRENRLKKLLKVCGPDTIIISADLSTPEGCKKVLDRVKGLDIEVFINNAGFGKCGNFEDIDIRDEISMINVNVTAVHFLMKGILKQMRRTDSGKILNVASSAGLFPAGPYMSAYYATKAYVVSLTRGVAEELEEAGSNIYLGCLCPGPVDTEFNSVADVKFSLPGISPAKCARYAVRMMDKGKTVIVPKLTMKAAVFGGRFIPQKKLIKTCGTMQKKKLYN